MRITIRNLQGRIPVNHKRIAQTARRVLLSEGVKKSGEITLSFVSDEEIRKLNLKYLRTDTPTDVIAFDVAEPRREDKIFADIVISADRAVDNSKTFKTTPLSELYLYVIHGVLHILGYDDRGKRSKSAMRRKEMELLKLCARAHR